MSNCSMGLMERGKFDIIAILRLITSSLSIIGALSIVGSAIYRKTVCNPKVHPIFVLSIVDMLLSIMWISGAVLWLARGSKQSRHSGNKVDCFAINLITVILQCVAMNVTLIYALLAYSSIKQRDFSGIYMVLQQPVSVHVWPPLCSFLAYFIAWTLPVVLIMVPFGVIAVKFSIVQKANIESCWCLPFYGNVLPRPQLAANGAWGQEAYLHHLYHFISCYSAVLIVNFLVVFFSMLVTYYKVFHRIRCMKETQERNQNRPLFGATQAMILRGQKDAEKRVGLFLSIFFITGVVTLAFGVSSIIIDVFHISPHYVHASTKVFMFLLFEALLVPVQGALNAVAYGWTRGDFLSVMSSQYFSNKHIGDSVHASNDSMDNEAVTVEEEEEREEEEEEVWEGGQMESPNLYSYLRPGETPAPGGEAWRQRGGTVMTPDSPS